MSSKKSKPEPREEYRVILSTGIAMLNLPAKVSFNDRCRLHGFINLLEDAPVESVAPAKPVAPMAQVDPADEGGGMTE